MADLNAKLARQQTSVLATKTTIAKMEQIAKNAKDDRTRINANLVLVQLRTKLQRQLDAVQLTEWTLDIEAQVERDLMSPRDTRSPKH